MKVDREKGWNTVGCGCGSVKTSDDRNNCTNVMGWSWGIEISDEIRFQVRNWTIYVVKARPPVDRIRVSVKVVPGDLVHSTC